MSPHEHYLEAERLLKGHLEVLEETKARMEHNPDLGPELVGLMSMTASLLHQAQVHATLATIPHEAWRESEMHRV